MRNHRYTTLLALLLFVGPACGAQKATPAKHEEPRPASAGEARPVDLDKAPAGLRVAAKRVKLAKPFETIVRGERVSSREIVEFELSSKEPIPARALDPVLVVGERAVTSYRYAGPSTLVFTEPDPSKLPRSAPVQFRWGTEGPAYTLDYKFDLEALETIQR